MAIRAYETGEIPSNLSPGRDEITCHSRKKVGLKVLDTGKQKQRQYLFTVLSINATPFGVIFCIDRRISIKISPAAAGFHRPAGILCCVVTSLIEQGVCFYP